MVDSQNRNRANQNTNRKVYGGARQKGPPSPFGPEAEILIEKYRRILNQQSMLNLLILTFRVPYSLAQLKRYLKAKGIKLEGKKGTKLELVETPLIDREFILNQIPASVKKQYDEMFKEEPDVTQEK